MENDVTFLMINDYSLAIIKYLKIYDVTLFNYSHLVST